MSDPAEQFAEQRNLRLAEDIENICSSLAVVADTDFARLSERHFTQIFLPFFAGDQELMYPVTINVWLNVAGGPYRSVNIVGADGTIIFTVPPLFDRKAINPLSEGANSIAHVIATTAQYARIHPVQGLNYLSSELTQRALIMKVPASVLNELDTWNKIFTRYGRPPIMSVPESTDEPVSDPKDSIPHDDYDLL